MDVVLEHLPLPFFPSGNCELSPLLQNIVYAVKLCSFLLMHFPLLPNNASKLQFSRVAYAPD